MRDRERINRILTVLQEIWEYQPDVRFNQFISNLQYMYSEENNGYGKRSTTIKDGIADVETSYLDFFYLEDDEWETFLDGYLNELKDGRQKQITIPVINEIVELFNEASIEREKLSTPLFKKNLMIYLTKENKGVRVGGVVSIIKYLHNEQRRELFSKIMNVKENNENGG